MYNITRNMNELEEKCLRFVLRHYQKNKLDTRQALKVFKEKHGVVGRAGGKNRYFLFLSGLAAAILLAFIPGHNSGHGIGWKILILSICFR